MQKPMTDERLGCIENMHPLGLIAELCREIRRLRAENEEIREKLTGMFAGFCPPEEAMVLRKATADARAEVERLKEELSSHEEAMHDAEADMSAGIEAMMDLEMKVKRLQIGRNKLRARLEEK